jgi:hypothetical protein
MPSNLTPLPRRQGVKTRQVMYAEPDAAPGTNPGSPVGYILPLADESGFGTEQGRIQAPVFKGKRKPYGSVLGNINAAGEAPYGLEFRTFLRVLRQFVGPNGYTRPGGGTTSLHRIFTPTVDDSSPGSVQIEDQSLETPVQYIRNRYVRPGSINLSYANEGVARYGVSWMGIGDELRTSLAGTVNDEGYKAVSFFNGYAKLNGYYLVGMSDFAITFDGGLSRGDAAFRGGIAASVDFGVINISGRLALMFATNGAAPENNLNFYDMAVNNQAIPLEVIWTDTNETLSDSWCRIIIPGTKFSRRGFRPGGAAGKLITQDFTVDDDTASNKIAAEKYGIRGPYNIGASTFNLGVKDTGGSTIITALTQGAARTTDQVVTELNANVSFSAAFTAENFLGRVMIRHKTLGAAKSIQVDTATANSAHSILGFDNVVFSGFDDTPWLVEINNDITTNIVGGA